MHRDGEPEGSQATDKSSNRTGGSGSASQRAPVPSASGASMCAVCGKRQAGSDGICGGCRLAKFNQQRRKHAPLSPEVLAELQLAYIGRTVRAVSANLNRISSRWRIPKAYLKYEARRRGWRSMAERHPWTPADVRYLKEKLGTVSIARIAHNLKRSVDSIKAEASRLSLSARWQEGYNVSGLCEVFGVPHYRVEGWMRRGLLGKTHGHGGHGGEIRFTESNVVRFLRQYSQEYDLRRVDQTWFKAMLFGALADEGERV